MNEPDKFDRTMLTLSAEASALIAVLLTMKVGDVVPYAALSEAIGCDVRLRRHVLMTARNRVLRDDSVHTAMVAKVGIKRVSDDDAGDGGLNRALRRTRSAARRGRLIASRLNMNEIPQTKRAAVVAKASLLEMIDYGASAKAQSKALTAVAASDDKALPLRHMLAALKE